VADGHLRSFDPAVVGVVDNQHLLGELRHAPAFAADTVNRAKPAKSEIEFALRHKDICSELLDAIPPERVTHKDTKFNNVMLDDTIGEGICVIDLDTAMPGMALYDFGHMVGTTTSRAKEDERDLSKVTMQFRRSRRWHATA